MLRAAAAAGSLAEVDRRSSDCFACPRLVAWREHAAAHPRASFAGQVYWARPTPGFGPSDARILILGLAPAAHGGNRTGRAFTGDRAADWLVASLYRNGLANQGHSSAIDDGLELIDTRVVSAVRCAPPENRPTPAERDTCASWLGAELRLLAPTLRCVVALGGFAWQALWPALRREGLSVPRPRPAFGHGVRVGLGHPAGGCLQVIGCYHPSQQNTFTGKLTEAMLDDVFGAARGT